MEGTKGFDVLLSLDSREKDGKSGGRCSNSKVIMAKQFFETIGNNNTQINMPRQYN